MKTLIVIPTYNERENIQPLMREIFRVVPDVSVLMVDDSSPDGTGEEVQKLQQTYPKLFLLTRAVKDGLGNAYKAGFKKVMRDWPDTEVVMMMDADFYHDPSYIPELLRTAETTDMVIGSVHAKGGRMPASFPLSRKLLSWGGNFYCRLIFRYALTDWTNAFVAIRMLALSKIDLDALQTKEFAFVFGLKYKLLKSGASWKDIPVVANERTAGQSKIVFRTIQEALIAPWKLL